MNIRVHLSAVVGSDEKVIEIIEKCVKYNNPFGLKCQRSSVVFIPKQFTAYWIWSDGEKGPVFRTNNLAEFVDCIKMQYVSHRQLIGTDELLGIAKLLQYEQQQKRLDLLRNDIRPEPGQPSGPLGIGG